MKGFTPRRHFYQNQRHVKGGGKNPKPPKSDLFAEFTKVWPEEHGASPHQVLENVFTMPLVVPCYFLTNLLSMQHVENPRTALEVEESKLWPCFNKCC